MAMQALTLRKISGKLLEAKRRAVARFLTARKPLERLAAYSVNTHPDLNVVGVGIGAKIVQGRVTDRPCVRFYVERKVDRDGIPRRLLLPQSLDGVPTDVIQTGRFRALPGSLGKVRDRLRPARPGCSIGFQFTGRDARYVMAGTFGAVVESGGKRFILSNNHVLANENALGPGAPIFQPGLLDGGNPARDRIATLTRFVRLAARGRNHVDCAIAEVRSRQSVSATVLPRVGRLESSEPEAARERMKVEKTGRTTGYTVGEIRDVSADVKIEYDLGVLRFENQIVIVGKDGSFSDSGDSGSLIVSVASKRPVGLLFAGSESHTLANPIDAVLEALRVAIVR